MYINAYLFRDSGEIFYAGKKRGGDDTDIQLITAEWFSARQTFTS